MILRRDVVLGGLLTILWKRSCLHAQSFSLGCSISDSEIVNRFGSSPNALSFNVDRDQFQNGSGNKDFDRALAQTLSRLSDKFNVLPGFAFFNDATSFNALASPSRRLGRSDGSVFFGQKMFEFLMRNPISPEAGIAAVCAHEFGHILQYKLRIDEQLITSDRRVKRLELHADFLAGYFAGWRKRENPDFPAAIFAQTQDRFGDTSFNDKNHHGTSEERGAAVVQGFNAAYNGKMELSAAITTGLDYVSRVPG